jgi:hypothetical protein
MSSLRSAPSVRGAEYSAEIAHKIMNPQIEIKHNIGNTILVPNQIESRAKTYFGSNVLTGVTSLPVDNASDFTSGSNILLLLSTLGQENAEIVQSTSHTNMAFTTGATIMPHSRGEVINQIAFDQIVISKATTINGSYSVFATQTMQVTQKNTIIFDSTGLTTDYYKVQWKNSISGLLSPLSSPISVSSLSAKSAGYLINSVTKAMGVQENDVSVTPDFLLSALNDARDFTQGKLYGIRMAWRSKFEYPLRMYAGRNYVDLPSNVEFNETDRSVLAVRLLVNNILTPYNLRYIDKRSWNTVAYNMMGGTVAVAATIGDNTLQLSSTGDFLNGGVAYVATDDFSQLTMQIQFTGNDLNTNTLTGVTGITRNIPVGTQVWVRPTIAQPINYTVFEGKIVFDRVIPDVMQGQNVYIDYYKTFDPILEYTQDLEEPYKEIYKWYLRYAIKYKKDIYLPKDDPDLKKFEDLVQALFDNLYSGQDSIIITN